MEAIRDLLSDLAEFEKTPQSRGIDLRMDLAEIVLSGLRRKGWTQKQLADVAGMKPSFLTRVIHGSSNCTFDVAGRLLFALDVRAKLIESDGAVAMTSAPEISLWTAQIEAGQRHGKQIDHEKPFETQVRFATESGATAGRPEHQLQRA